MTITDSISLILSVFLILRGFNRGFLGSILGPLAFIIGSLISFVYYALTDNIPVSLCIGLFGPFLLTWIFKFFLSSWKKMTHSEGKFSLASQIGGASLTFSWGMAMWVITLLILALFPPINNPLKKLSNDIHYSWTYKIISPLDFTAAKKTAPSATSNTTSKRTASTTAAGISINTTQEAEIKSLSEDKKIQDLMKDPQIIKAIEKKDYAFLMSSPKIMAIVQDPELLKRMLNLYKNLPKDALPQ